MSPFLWVCAPPETGASGSPVFPGHVRDHLRCFSGRARQELRFEWCWSDVGLTVPEIWPFSWKLLFFGRMSKFDSGALPVFVFVFVCANLYLYLCICICICVFVFVFDHDYLMFWFIFDENPFLRLRLASHDNLGFFSGKRAVSRRRNVRDTFRIHPWAACW